MNHNHHNIYLKYGLFHNMPIFISFEQVGGGGGGGLVEAEPIDAAGKTATTTSYSGDIVNHYTYQGRKLAKKVYNSQHTLTVDEEYYDELMFSFGKPSRISHGDGYIALSDNGGATFYYYLKDHLGNVRSVILPDANNQPVVSQANDYFPFGMSFESTLPNPGIRANYNKLKYNGKEEQEMPGKWLDYGARFYDAQIGRFTTLDRFAVDFSSWSPYHYANNNPILNIDINGDSTFVAVNDNGTYTVTGGNLYNKEDKGLYSMNVDGTYTQVGETLTTHSFFDDNGNAVVGAVIDPNSNEGTEFIIELAMDNPELTEYMVNATNGEKYDFKEKGIDERPEGTTIDQHRYRGSAASDGVYGSARDFGNIGAGMVAGRKGLSWKQARLGFDTYQSYKSKKITSEGQTTQKAQKVGFSIGIQLRKKEK